MELPIISVSQFVGIINETLSVAFPQVVVEGEVSGFKINQGKFAFFDLKDESSTLNCFMMAFQLRLPIEDGMKIRVTGTPKITKWGKFSLTVKSVELAGEGELRRAMALLQRKLEAEGLFAPERKRPLPRFPRRIGLITSGTSAAYSDFIKILGARWGGLQVQLADVTVQGQTAPDQIVGALHYFNGTAEPPDVVVLIRGGGSLEDLAAFSTEPVARAVAASRAPIIVGVGHETDLSLADYAADLRAATPTDAARLVVPDRQELAEQVRHRVAQLESRLRRHITGRQAATALRLTRLEGSLRAPIRQALNHTAALQQRLLRAEQALADERWARLASLTRVLQGFDPQATLARGYAIVRGPEGRIVKRSADVRVGQSVIMQLAQGSLAGEVVESKHESQ